MKWFTSGYFVFKEKILASLFKTNHIHCKYINDMMVTLLFIPTSNKYWPNIDNIDINKKVNWEQMFLLYISEKLILWETKLTFATPYLNIFLYIKVERSKCKIFNTVVF